MPTYPLRTISYLFMIRNETSTSFQVPWRPSCQGRSFILALRNTFVFGWRSMRIHALAGIECSMKNHFLHMFILSDRRAKGATKSLLSLDLASNPGVLHGSCEAALPTEEGQALITWVPTPTRASSTMPEDASASGADAFVYDPQPNLGEQRELRREYRTLLSNAQSM